VAPFFETKCIYDARLKQDMIITFDSAANNHCTVSLLMSLATVEFKYQLHVSLYSQLLQQFESDVAQPMFRRRLNSSMRVSRDVSVTMVTSAAMPR